MTRTLGVLLICCAAAACDTAATSGGDAKGDGKGSVVTLDGLKSATPADWKTEKPATQMRSYQFRLPKAGGDADDAELIVFFFGAGGGGSVADNLKRWKGLFQAPEGKTPDDVAKVDTFKVGEVKVTYLDVSGTYLSKNPGDPNAKAEKRADYRRFGVIFESPNGPYFITLTGPARTMEQHKKAFDEWLKNFK